MRGTDDHDTPARRQGHGLWGGVAGLLVILLLVPGAAMGRSGAPGGHPCPEVRVKYPRIVYTDVNGFICKM